jgi:hypothetical protein
MNPNLPITKWIQIQIYGNLIVASDIYGLGCYYSNKFSEEYTCLADAWDKLLQLIHCGRMLQEERLGYVTEKKKRGRKKKMLNVAKGVMECHSSPP